MHFMLALDDSRYAETIMKWMSNLPHPEGTRLTLLHVIEPLDIPLEFASGPMFQDQQQAGARAFVKHAVRVLQKSYPEVNERVVEGFPIYEILKSIHEQHPDVIVSGTRGLRGAKGLALGSVSQRLLTYAPCSVMLIPATIRSSRRLKVMLATDGSPGAKEAARFLTLLPDLKEVTVVTTLRPIEARNLGTQKGSLKAGPGSVRAQLMHARRASAEKAVEETLAVLRTSGLVLKTRILIGHPAEAIPAEAKKVRCNLLVVGSRGLTGKMAMALGSVSLAVAQSAPCPVLVVKQGT